MGQSVEERRELKVGRRGSRHWIPGSSASSDEDMADEKRELNCSLSCSGEVRCR
jgi:hypothetical protein